MSICFSFEEFYEMWFSLTITTHCDITLHIFPVLTALRKKTTETVWGKGKDVGTIIFS